MALIAAALVVFAFAVVWSNSMFTSTIQALIPDQVRSRVDSYDMLVSIVIMPLGYVIAGPLSSSVGITTTLVGAAIVGAVPDALTAIVPGNRAVHRTAAGGIAGPAGEVVGPAEEGAGPVGEGAGPVGEGAGPAGEGAGSAGEGAGPAGEGAGSDGEGAGPSAADTDNSTAAS